MPTTRDPVISTSTAQHAATREKEEYERKLSALAQEAADQAALNVLRANLRPNDVVKVSRFDRTGRVVRVDAKKQMVTVSVGLVRLALPSLKPPGFTLPAL